MPDVVTHLAAATLLRVPFGGRHVSTFVLGSVLPDLLSRVPSMGLSEAARLGVPVPEALIWAWTPLHLPAGILLVSLLLSQWAPPGDRRPAFLALAGGGALHVALDLLQRHTGQGYLLLFPFSDRDFEIGIFGSEATVPLAPWLAAAAALLIGIRWRATARRRDATPS